MTASPARATEARFLMSLPRWKVPAPFRWPQVAVAGRSNVGKSSLINALLGRRGLARTSATPGRTQTLNFFLVNEAFVLADLPGYGYARAPLAEARRWAAHTREYLASADALRGVVLLLDIRRDPSAADLEFVSFVRRARRPLVAVLTKGDKVARGHRARRTAIIGEALGAPAEDIVITSSRTGDGREFLWRRILELVQPTEAPAVSEPRT